MYGDNEDAQVQRINIHTTIINAQNRLTLKAPNTTIAEFANTADPDETAHNEPSHLDLQCLPSKV